MAKFNYTAEDSQGEVYQGTAEAADRFELYDMIRREGATVVSVSQNSEDNIWSLAYWNARFSTVPIQQKIVVTRNLGAMLAAGLSLGRALSVLERQTNNARLKMVLAHVGSDVRKGSALHESLARFPKVFSKLFIAMVKSGEESGGLSETLGQISKQMDQSHTLKKKVRSALIYPSIIVVAIIGIGILMLTQVVPTLSQTFNELGAELPASTQAIIAISDFLIKNTVLALGLASFAVFVVVVALRTRAGSRARDFVLVKMPLIGGIVREVNAARTTRTMNSLLSSGVDMITALSITGEVVQNAYFRDVLREASEDVRQGKLLSKAFMRREDLYPPLVGEMIAVGEETGALSEMLDRVAEFYENEVARKTKDMSTIIEPFLMVLIGAAVGFFAISMVAPIYSLSESI